MGGQQIKSGYFLLKVSHHGEGLAAAGLSVCEAGDFGFVEGRVDDGSDDLLVDVFVDGVVCEDVVEREGVLFDKLGHVDFGPGEQSLLEFADDEGVRVAGFDDVFFFLRDLFAAERSLPNHNSDFGDGINQRVVRVLHLKVIDHSNR